MVDNLADTDEGGSNAQWVKVWLGPTIGWKYLPVDPERIIEVPGNITIQPFDSKLLLQASVEQVFLPDIVAWVEAAYQRNISSFDRSIWIKDLGGNCGSVNTVVFPFGTQTIDGLPQYTIAMNYALIRLYPLTDLSGWYVG